MVRSRPELQKDPAALGRVLDPAELDASKGPRGEHRLTVPRAWGARGVRLAVTLPKRLPCARCHGGGCDGCHRSGALKGPEDAQERRVHFDVPCGSDRAVAVRVCWPFGRDRSIAQIIFEVHLGDEASSNVERLRPLSREVEVVRHSPPAVAIDLRLVGVLLVILAVSILLFAH